ncbi:ribonuclease H-like domain-containing protein [Fomitopsis serialis]|uniref:ribonuclease H-like domain-containing protein n=1 Tax=Fomitopsis serialis TaxID=139415 RepID=UPI0020089FF0|nr:ribonuclease H-like domain-containing protein [Neoantrodia serialis]KAH9923646.1 ribonuclease H-like domain-containing protein [Neoantrodia serialis]
MASTHDPDAGSQHIFNRKYHLCELLSSYSTEDLIKSCRDCSRFIALCCRDRSSDRALDCHHYRLVFTDGSCLSNGRPVATAGLGIAVGLEDDQQWSISVDDSLDAFAKRSSQRAELLAALVGLIKIDDVEPPDDPHERLYNRHNRSGDNPEEPPSEWIVTTDSIYVVNGMAEWLPNIWKRNGMRTSDGRTPANLDLFLKLDEWITALELRRNVRIGFWHIPREFNAIADRLAKNAAARGTVASPLSQS